MANESIVIEIDGQEAPELYDDFVALEVEQCHELPATFQLRLALRKDPEDGSWVHLDDERLRVWKRVTLRIGFVDSGAEDLLDGYITRVTPHFAPEERDSVLEVAGMDASVLMDREEKLKAWPNKKDSDIASEILGDHDFDADVEDTRVVHDEKVSTVIQRETDLQFLQRLARRNGFNIYVEGDVGYFRSVPADATPQPLLAAHFGDETNLSYFSATVDALRTTDVAMAQVDRLNKEVIAAEAVTAVAAPLGSLDAAGLRPPAVDAGRVHIARNAATGTPEMTALVQGLFRKSTWFVDGEGGVDTAVYGHVLRPRALVTIKGVGETYSGVYYVSFVRHTVTRDGYAQYFRVMRDALMLTGAEDFGGSGGGLGLL